MQINEKNFERYSRQIILKKIGISGQKKIASAKVLIVGAGGLGCPTIIYLANAGVGNIGIIDHDKIALSNLNRQILFKTSDIGKYKVDIATKFVKQINNKIKVLKYKTKLNKRNISTIFKKYQIICDGTDNFETRYLINDYSLKYKKILISAAISKFEGHIFNFNFKKKIPCYRCFMPELPNYENNCETEGIFPTLAGIAGTLQANEVVKTILNFKNILHRKLLVFNSMTSETRKIKFSKNLNCTKECVNR
jgi:molybdopterin-synthase adenylyltransferase